MKATGYTKRSSMLVVACLSLCLLSFATLSSVRDPAAAQTQSPPSICPQLNSNKVATEWIGRRVHHTISASLAGGTLPKPEPTYQWQVSPGKITSGQGTHSIKVEMPDCECDVHVVTEVEGLDAGCQKRVEWGVNDLCFYPVSNDSYGDIGWDEERRLLSKHVPILKSGQCWQMWITPHGDKGERAGETLARAKRARQYLVSEHGVEAERVSVMAGEPAGERRISLSVFHGRFTRTEGARP